MRYGLPETTIQEICGVLAKFPSVAKAVLYGSRAKGNFKNGSDIDLTLLGGPDLNLQVLSRIMDAVDNLPLPYTFDLSILSNIKDEDFLDHIKRVGVIFYERVKTRDGRQLLFLSAL